MLFITNGTFNAASKVVNPQTHEVFSIAGKRGSSTVFTADDDDRMLSGDSHATNHHDAIIYDLTLGGTSALRLSGFNHFLLGEGNDVLDLTSRSGHAAYDYGERYDPNGFTTDLVVDAGSGDDVVWTGASNDFVVGDEHNPFTAPALAVGGDDAIDGGAGNDYIFGDVYDGGPFTAGDDVLAGGAGRDRIFGEAFHTSGGLVAGNDELRGGSGADQLYGDVYIISGLSSGQSLTFGDDKLYGGAGNDQLYGDFDARISDAGTFHGGDDRLVGGAGDDTLYGDSSNVTSSVVIGGADVFVFANGDGQDVIGDFGRGADRIDVSAFGFTSFAEVSNLITYNGAHNVATIAFDADDSITVNQYAQASFTLSDADFIFA